jgi:uncharacterized membrane protein YvbJ
VYCPNCGEEQALENVSECSECSMPLAGVAEQVVRFRAESPEYQRQQREAEAKKKRLVGVAAFLALAAVPVGWGVKNSLQQAKPEPLPPAVGS